MVDSQVDGPNNADGAGGVLGKAPVVVQKRSFPEALVYFEKVTCIQNEANSLQMNLDVH